jgi:hypothetical protein
MRKISSCMTVMNCRTIRFRSAFLLFCALASSRAAFPGSGEAASWRIFAQNSSNPGISGIGLPGAPSSRRRRAI